MHSEPFPTRQECSRPKCPKRHEDAKEFGVEDKQIVKVRLDTSRPLIFDDVVVRVSPKFALAMHIDTDECNAAAAFGTVYGEIVD